MLRESNTAVVARGDCWQGAASTEPFEAGWATEAVIFVRLLDPPTGVLPDARVQISPDGMRWIDEGTTMSLPRAIDLLAVARVTHFGNWLRIAADLPEGASATVLVTLHLK